MSLVNCSQRACYCVIVSDRNFLYINFCVVSEISFPVWSQPLYFSSQLQFPRQGQGIGKRDPFPSESVRLSEKKTWSVIQLSSILDFVNDNVQI